MENYPSRLFYLEFSIPLIHKPLTNQNTAFLCERNYGKLSRLLAGRIMYITFSLAQNMLYLLGRIAYILKRGVDASRVGASHCIRVECRIFLGEGGYGIVQYLNHRTENVLRSRRRSSVNVASAKALWHIKL